MRMQGTGDANVTFNENGTLSMIDLGADWYIPGTEIVAKPGTSMAFFENRGPFSLVLVRDWRHPGGFTVAAVTVNTEGNEQTFKR